MMDKQRHSQWLQSLKSKRLASGGEEKQLVAVGLCVIRGGEFGLGPVNLQVRCQIWM